MFSGGVVTILIMIPNVIWMRFPPRDSVEGVDQSTTGPARVMVALEWVGRIAALVLPFFYQISSTGSISQLTLALTVLSILFYYAGWVRYFARGRTRDYLFEPLLLVPIPLAISPIICLLAASANFRSWPLALSTVVLAVGHLWITARDASKIRREGGAARSCL